LTNKTAITFFSEFEEKVLGILARKIPEFVAKRLVRYEKTTFYIFKGTFREKKFFLEKDSVSGKIFFLSKRFRFSFRIF